jgi:hypothetical protein
MAACVRKARAGGARIADANQVLQEIKELTGCRSEGPELGRDRSPQHFGESPKRSGAAVFAVTLSSGG